MLKILIISSVFFGLSSARLCRQECLRSLNPICVLEHGVPRQFGNHCELDRYNCVNRTALRGQPGYCSELYPDYWKTREVITQKNC